MVDCDHPDCQSEYRTACNGRFDSMSPPSWDPFLTACGRRRVETDVGPGTPRSIIADELGSSAGHKVSRSRPVGCHA